MSTLTGERWRALSPYLDEALELGADEREPWLARLRNHDPGLAADLAGLLAEREVMHRDGFLEGAAVVLHRDYVRSLEASGAAVVVLPPLEEPTAAADVVTRLDGLVLAGGADVDPASYGADADPTTDRPRTDRDATEVSLWRAARGPAPSRRAPLCGA